MRSIAFATAALLAAFATAVAAQEAPARAGRVAYLEGAVSLYQDPEAGWEKAYANSPLTGENSLWTEPRARAEVRVSGITLRMAEATQLDVARLDDEALEAFVPRGSLAVRVGWIDRGQRLLLTTPQGRLLVEDMGRLRLDVDASRDETLLTVFAGRVLLTSSGDDVPVAAGEALRIHGDGEYTRERARTAALDRWADSRDAQLADSRTTRYVSPYMTGYEDLDRYGEWIEDADYGPIWYPTAVGGDWVPYRQGHWSWVNPWGWTWVAYEPWGYAPYHYGRWVQVRGRWCWAPGQRVDRPVWAPALVGWVGGSGFSVTVGGRPSPALGWYPLAPWERYQPWWRASPTYVNRVNVVVRDRPPRDWKPDGRDGDWRHWNRDRGATVVRRDGFGDRKPVGNALVNVTPDQINRLPQSTAPAAMPPRPERRPATSAGPATMPAGASPLPQPVSPPPGTNPLGQQRPTPPAPGANPLGRQRPTPSAAPAPVPTPAPQAAPRPAPAATQAAPATMPAAPAAGPFPTPQPQPQNPQANPLGKPEVQRRTPEERAIEPQRRQQQLEQQRSLQEQARQAREAEARGAKEPQRAQQEQQRAQKEQQRAQHEQQRAQQEQARRAAREAKPKEPPAEKERGGDKERGGRDR